MNGGKYMHFTVKLSNVFWNDVCQSYLLIFRVKDKIISMQKSITFASLITCNKYVVSKTMYAKMRYKHCVRILSDFFK